jgi:hypothetical protein
VSAPKIPPREDGKCACGCGWKVPPYAGKGRRSEKRYASAACGARVRVARFEARNPELAAERKRAAKAKKAAGT